MELPPRSNYTFVKARGRIQKNIKPERPLIMGRPFLILAVLVYQFGCRGLNNANRLSDNLYQEKIPSADTATKISDAATIEINPSKIVAETLKATTGEDSPQLTMYIRFSGARTSTYNFKKWIFAASDVGKDLKPLIINVKELNTAVASNIGKNTGVHLEISVYDYDFSWLDLDDFVGRQTIALADLLYEPRRFYELSPSGRSSCIEISVDLKGLEKQVAPIAKDLARQDLLNELEKDRQYLMARAISATGNFQGDRYKNFVTSIHDRFSTLEKNQLQEVATTPFGGFAYDLVQVYVDILRQVDATTFDVTFSVKLLNSEKEQEKGAKPVREISAKNFRAHYVKEGFWTMTEIK